MSPSEIAFLALGLVLGAAIGAALAQALRGLPGSSRREVRLTITPNAIPSGRTRTVATSRTTGEFGPTVDPSEVTDLPGQRPATPGTAFPNRTRVPTTPVTLPSTAIGVPVGGVRQPATPGRPGPAGSPAPVGGASPAAPAQAQPAQADPPPPVPAPVRPAAGPPPTRDGTPRASLLAPVAVARAAVAVLEPPAPSRSATAPQAVRPLRDDTFTTLVRPRPPVDDPRPGLVRGAVPVVVPPAAGAAPVRPALPATRLAPPSAPTLTRPPLAPPARASIAVDVVRPRAEADHGAPAPATSSPAPESSATPCAGPRRTVDERCALADAAREHARTVLDALRDAQRAYDVLRERVDRAESIADPRRVAAEKERLHATFRAASDRAGGPDDAEAAARAWLDELNALNAAVREAHRTVESGNAELRAALPMLERRSAEADAARIASENADAGCRDARQELAECEEAQARAYRAPQPPDEEPHPFARVWPVDRPDLPGRDAEPAEDLLAGLPVIVRILRGDRDARERLVAQLGAEDPAPEREWQLRISRLVDAIMGRAIEDGYLDLPDDDPFWRLFERRESRDIVGALSALGFRYDGLGGFADGRAPAARDLSLAVGYAGLDRMRIRSWPHEGEIGNLYRRAVVAADEWLADEAGDLSLGQMVDALGGRAAELADVWNAWGRVRPALLAR